MRGCTYVSLLSLTDAGQNKVRILQLSLTHIVGYVHNVAEDGKETDLVGIIGKRDKISDRRYQKFKKEATDRGIPEENIVNFTDNGNEITLFF
ncbi:hypothetical protein G4228_018815 [Cervus hanglu yarkandensis]|nr:hypothetical protein G4228_018815 [Cervus hanglu yarkandensis]